MRKNRLALALALFSVATASFAPIVLDEPAAQIIESGPAAGHPH